MIYIIYDTTGKILRSGTCPPEDIDIQAGPGETAMQIDNQIDINNHIVVNGVITPYTPPIDSIVQLKQIRVKRNNLLSTSDWTQISDSPLSADKKQEWASYRQNLRDLPAVIDLENQLWPTPPSNN